MLQRTLLLVLLSSFSLLAGSCQSFHPLGFTSDAISVLLESKRKSADAMAEVLIARADLLNTIPSSEEEAAAIKTYNDKAGHFVKKFGRYLEEGGVAEEDLELTASNGTVFQLHFPDKSEDERLYAAQTLSGVRLAGKVSIKRDIWGATGSREGLGVPLVFDFDSDDNNPERAFYPPGGLPLPVTAVFDLEDASVDLDEHVNEDAQHIIVRLQDPNLSYNANLGSRSFELAANLTAPLPDALDPGVIHGLGLAGLFRPAQGLDSRGLYQLQPADPDRVPVIFVHGLNSAPLIWRRNINALMSDPVLSQQFQVLYFAYPTGMSIPASAAALREQFSEWRSVCDPEGDDIASEHAIFVGHSMGGLLSRMQVIDSGEYFWDAFFAVSADEMNFIDDDSMDELRRSLYFDNTDGVDAVFFLGTPHRGSDLASITVLSWIFKLIKIPGSTLRLVQFGLDNPTEVLFNPRLQSFRSFGLDSVSQLEPSHPYFDALNSPEIEAPHHSIIGVVQGNRPLEETSDLVVPYTSSHLDTAETEEYVHHWHNFTSTAASVELVDDLLLYYAEELPDVERNRDLE